MPEMVYRWRSGRFQGTARHAQQVGERLERLRLENDGVLVAQDVVADARVETSPLHRFFEWDDRAAARAHRLEQAKQLVTAVAVVSAHSVEPTPAFVPTIANGTGGAAFTRAAAPVFAMPVRSTDEEIDRGRTELLAWRRRYAALPQFAHIVAVIDEELKEYERRGALSAASA